MVFRKRKKTWKNPDVTEIEGVGEDYADLLGAAGIETVKQLRYRNPGRLTVKLVEVNQNKKIVERLPSEAMVERWVGRADRLVARQNADWHPAAAKKIPQMPIGDD